MATVGLLLVSGVWMVGCAESDPAGPGDGRAIGTLGSRGTVAGSGTVYVASALPTASELEGATVEGDVVVRDGDVIGTVVEEEDIPELEAITAEVVCYYLVYYWLDTKQIISVTFLFCTGGGGGDPPEEFAELTCPDTVRRGEQATCNVRLDSVVRVDDVMFKWSAGENVWEGTGAQGYAIWEGKAIDSLAIVVTVEGPDTLDLMKTVNVQPRKWTISPDTARLNWATEGWFAKPNRWGEYHPVYEIPPPVSGSGPWADMYMMSRPPGLHADDTVLALHTDLSGVHGSAYPDANNTCDGSSALPDSANVVAVNHVCGTSDALGAWGRDVGQHEKRHEASLHSCLRSSRTNQKLQEMEKITGEFGKVRMRTTEIWKDFVRNVLNEATEANLGSMTSPEIWDYRFSKSWKKGKLTSEKHGGTWGC